LCIRLPGNATTWPEHVGNLRSLELINIVDITLGCRVCCNYRPMEKLHAHHFDQPNRSPTPPGYRSFAFDGLFAKGRPPYRQAARAAHALSSYRAGDSDGVGMQRAVVARFPRRARLSISPTVGNPAGAGYICVDHCVIC
jgi:hypothetical protein